MTVEAPSKALEDLLMAVDFQEGQTYLVSADGDRVTLCGFTAETTPELQALYTEAFPPRAERRRQHHVVSPTVGAMTVGLLLAAGEGRRFGGPKALARDDDGTSWLLRAVQALRPCSEVVVVLGAEAERAAALLPMSVVAHPRGRLGRGDGRLAPGRAGGAGPRPTTTRRSSRSWTCPTSTPRSSPGSSPPRSGRGDLARAAYDGVPGHPVLLGRDHWAGVVASATGDRGARDYLAAHDVDLVECGDLATGVDVDQR